MIHFESYGDRRDQNVNTMEELEINDRIVKICKRKKEMCKQRISYNDLIKTNLQ